MLLLLLQQLYYNLFFNLCIKRAEILSRLFSFCSQKVVSPMHNKKRGKCFAHPTALFLAHHQWARQEFSPVRLSACKASILLRKTARAVVRRARRTLFAPRFRLRSIVAPAHKPATIFSDQSPRDEHERLREVRVRPEGNGAAKKPQHLLRLFLVHHRGLSRALKTPHWGVFARRTGGGLELFSSPDGAPD